MIFINRSTVASLERATGRQMKYLLYRASRSVMDSVSGCDASPKERRETEKFKKNKIKTVSAGRGFVGIKTPLRSPVDIMM